MTNIETDPKTTMARSVAKNRPNRNQAEAAVRTLIAYVGDDPNREGLLETPKRIIDSYEELYRGYREDAVTILGRTFRDTAGYSDFVLVKDIPFNSHCEHHMMPLHGVVHLAYIPKERVVGLSKLARLVDLFALRLQSQENMTIQIATAIEEVLESPGVAVMIDGEHSCMSIRGVKKSSASTTTMKIIGRFKTEANLQIRFMKLVSAGRP